MKKLIITGVLLVSTCLTTAQAETKKIDCAFVKAQAEEAINAYKELTVIINLDAHSDTSKKQAAEWRDIWTHNMNALANVYTAFCK